MLTCRKMELNETVWTVLLENPKKAFWLKSLPLKSVRKRYKSLCDITVGKKIVL